MKQETVTISEESSASVDFSSLILSVRQINYKNCAVVVGYPGLKNVVKNMEIGEAMLYETPNDGILEVRVVSKNDAKVGLLESKDDAKVGFLVSQVSPRLGIVGGFVDEDFNNSPFSSNELTQIASSVTNIKKELTQRDDIEAEQLELISRKLDEIHDASNRLGRKDWIGYVAGTLTSLCISAALSPEVSKVIFVTFDSAFAWLFENALKLLT